jgi:hypothetical protein
LKKIFSDFLEIEKAIEENQILSKEDWILGEDFRKGYSGRNIIVRKRLLPDDVSSSGNVCIDFLDWFFSFSTAHNFANFNFNFGFSNEVTLTSAFDTKGTPGLKLPPLHSTLCHTKQIKVESLIHLQVKCYGRS